MLPVGIVFIVSGFVKIIDSRSFATHLYKLGVGPRKRLPEITFALIAFETVLGFALIFFFQPQILILFALVILLFFIAVTFWSTSTGKVEDCGCYGGLLAIKPATSMMLDILYILLLVPAYLLLEDNFINSPLALRTDLYEAIKLAALAVVFILAFIYSKKSFNEELMEISRLKQGRTWKQKWVPDIKLEPETQKYFIIFLGKSCPHCKKWMPLINIMNTQKDLPRVFGIMNVSGNEVEEFKKDHLIRFPIINMDKLLWNTMIKGVPTAVLVENGIIKEKWVGKFPEEYLERVRIFMEPLLVPQKESTTFAG